MKAMRYKKPVGIVLLTLVITTAVGCASAAKEPEQKALESPSGQTATVEEAPPKGTARTASNIESEAAADVSVPGAFSWQELTTTNVSAAKGFYRALLGWNTLDVTQEGDSKRTTYTVLKVGDEEIGGIVAMPNPQRGDVAYWAPYVTVDNVDATAKHAEELGGKIIVPPTNIPTFGRYAVIQDPQGAEFSIIRYDEESE